MSFFSNIENTNPDCYGCGLHEHSKNSRMGVFGSGKKKILIIGKSPSVKQDLENNLFVGEATNLLREELKNVGIDLENDCWFVNSLGCRSTEVSNEQLKKKIDFCRPRVKKVIKQLKPNIILCLGTSALYSIFGEKRGIEQVTGISAEVFRSYLIPNYEYNCNVVGIFHPVEALQNQNDVFWYSLWKRDIEQFSKWVSAPLKKKINHRDKVVCLYEYKEVISALTDLLKQKPEYCVYDYEGTGVDLFIPNSRIETISFSPISSAKDFDRENQIAYAFPYQRLNHFTKEQQETIRELWVQFLKDTDIKKVAHNITLEYTWDLVGFDTDTCGDFWDSMVVANQINCTPGTRGLKFLALVTEGEIGYGSEAKTYFERKQENGLNYIHDFPLNKLLLYNGLDSLFNAYLFIEQWNHFKCFTDRKFKPREAMFWYNRIAKEMARYHAEGVSVDLDYYKKIKQELILEKEKILEQLNNTKEAKKFVSKENRLPNWGSDPDLRLVFYEYGGHDIYKLTNGGSASVDKESMHELEGTCAELLLQYRKIEKTIGTYIGQFETLAVDGKVHPVFNLTLKTMRTSCQNPNLQNIAKHDAFQKKVIRRGVIADKDCYFGEVDYSGVELYMNAFIANDSTFLEMLSTPGINAHTEFAKYWYDLSNEQISKPIRNHSKTGVTFAQAYGSNYWACAKKCWDWFTNEEVLTGDGITLEEHLRINGIKSERDFIDFWEKKEEEYWDKFHEWREYQEKTVDIYLKKGYVETPSGYRRVGMMNRNKILNTPAQNAGAFCLLASAWYINNEARKNKMKSRLMLQVHDSNGMSVHKNEVQDFLNLVEYGMCDWTFEQFDFLKMKLGVEVEMSSKPDQSWYDLVIWDKNENGIWEIKGE
jgi:uracil-DNA glycosylase family 4